MGQRQEHKYNLGHILWHMPNHHFFSIELIRITATAVLSILLVASFSAFQTIAIFHTHIGTTASFISSLMSNSMFQRWFSALLIPIVSSTVMEVIALNFFFECSMVTIFFSRLQNSSKDEFWEYELLKGNCKNLRHGQYHLINQILIGWYKKCVSANEFPDGPMLKEEAMLKKERLNKNELATYFASNSWLEKFKQTYRLHEKRITGEEEYILKWPFNHDLNACQN